MNDTPSPTPLRERILEAVDHCFARYGITKTTVSDVARELGVSRMTVYRQFKDRDALFRGAVLRNNNRLWLRTVREMNYRGIVDLDDWLAEGVFYFVERHFQNDDRVRLYLDMDAFHAAMQITLQQEGIQAMAAHLQPLYDKAQREGRIPEGMVIEDLVEWLQRITYHLMVQPGSLTNDSERLRRWIGFQVYGGLVKPAPPDHNNTP